MVLSVRSSGGGAGTTHYTLNMDMLQVGGALAAAWAAAWAGSPSARLRSRACLRPRVRSPPARGAALTPSPAPSAY